MCRCLLFLGFLLISGGAQTRDRASSRIKIIVVNSFGGPVNETARVDVRSHVLSKTVQIRTRGFIDLPPGDYTVECSAPSYAKASRLLSVYNRDSEVLFGLGIQPPEQLVGEGPITPWVLAGKIEPPPKSFTLVKLFGLFSSVSSESEVGSDGAFKVMTTSQGRYVLVVMAAGAEIYRKQIDLDISIPKSVNLLIDLDTPARK